MRRLKTFESFVSNKPANESKSLSIGGSVSYILESISEDMVSEASLSDFKPSLTMTKWAIVDRTNANDAIKFATAVAQQWGDLDDSTKENALGKWKKLKSTYKYQVAQIQDSDRDKDKAAVSKLSEVTDQAKDIYASKIEPLYKDGGEKTKSGNEEALKKELETSKEELKKAKEDFKVARAKYDELKDSGDNDAANKVWDDEVRPLVTKKEDLADKVSELEAELDDEE